MSTLINHMTMLVVILIELIRSRCSRSLRIGCGQANPSIDWINASNREYEMVNGVYSQPLLIPRSYSARQ